MRSESLHVYAVTDDGIPVQADDARALSVQARDEERGQPIRRDPSGQLGLSFSRDVHDLGAAGWALLVPGTWSEDRVARVRAALEPLCARRKQEAGPLYHEGRIPAGIDARGMLARPETRGSLWTPVDPQPGRLPYYVLLLGDPRDTPFSLQCELAIQYAVGRLDFAGDVEAEVEAYRRYAAGVVAHESAVDGGAPPVTLLGTRDDEATQLSWSRLLTPLATAFACEPHELRSGTLREHLSSRTCRSELLVTACHGRLCRDPTEASALQGALAGALEASADGERRSFFAGGDVDPAWDLGGLVSLHIACHGAGSPAAGRVRAQVSCLAQRMLSAPRPSLAFVGHLDRAWSTSFVDHTQRDLPSCATHYSDFLARMRAGWRLGAAFDSELTRHRLAVAAELTEKLRDLRGFPYLDPPEELAIATRWTAELDARNFIVLGDPAVRLGRSAR